MPTYLCQYRQSRWFSQEETVAMIYLKIWHHFLEKQARNKYKVTLLDHGPIFRLTWLREFGPEITNSQRFGSWWESTLDQWAATLDSIIWLDAPNDTLMERINARKRWHPVKGKSKSEMVEFLLHSRILFEQTLSKFTAERSINLIRFNTEEESQDKIIKKILVAFGMMDINES
jgi:hypothetical protein